MRLSLLRPALTLMAIVLGACGAVADEPTVEAPAAAQEAEPGGATATTPAPPGSTEPPGPTLPVTAASCFDKQFFSKSLRQALGVDYDKFKPTVGSHCKGTNHQDIKRPDRVVFLGDSVTVGTPPSNLNPGNVYRAILAKKLAAHFNMKAPGSGWGGANAFDGVALPRESGPFVSCAKWGARTDDFIQSNQQVEDCFPTADRGKRHLVIATMGGNDMANLLKSGAGDVPKKTLEELWTQTREFVGLMREAVTWMKNPANVPGGVDVVFANIYEFTDGTLDTKSCSAADLSGLEPWKDGRPLEEMFTWANEQYMKIAVDTRSDMVFMTESFCGRGFHRDDFTSRCYRSGNEPMWFDPTCIHPSNAGHEALAGLFFDTIVE